MTLKIPTRDMDLAQLYSAGPAAAASPASDANRRTPGARTAAHALLLTPLLLFVVDPVGTQAGALDIDPASTVAPISLACQQSKISRL